MSEKDKGQADAIAKGFRMAEGEIIAWLNSDDTYLPGSIDKVVALFCREPDAHIVYGKTLFTSEKEEVIGKYPTEPFDYTRLATFNFICQPSVFFRKSAFEETGGLDTNLRFVMDYDLWIRMARNYRFTYLPEYLSTYRLHDMSKTMAAGEAAANHKEALHTVMKHYGWAPANRVYGACHNLLKSRVPVFLADADVLLVPLSILFSLIRYVRLNRGIRFEDIKMINYRNVRKLFMKPIDIFKGY
jgi:GT2 family glycosyltransferase